MEDLSLGEADAASQSIGVGGVRGLPEVSQGSHTGG